MLDYVNVDTMPFIDGKGNQTVDIVMDIEKENLPWGNEEVSEIIVDNVLEHVGNLLFVLNECHRVLKPDGIMKGVVPIAGTNADFKDPTHKRHFVKGTFDYFTGSNPANPKAPGHPKYADYGYLPWNMLDINVVDELIFFKMTPRKV